MSSYVFMKALESTPARYDRGMQILTRGRIRAVYQAIASRLAHPGARILDVGCGTGEVALACAALGAQVDGIDLNAGILEVAIQKGRDRGLAENLHWHHLGAAEIEDAFMENLFDAVVFCLSMSEMSPDERAYSLAVTFTRLKPGGRLLIADEVVSATAASRFAHWLKRLPFAVATYLLTQTTTRPLPEIQSLVTTHGFIDIEQAAPWSDEFMILTARRP